MKLKSNFKTTIEDNRKVVLSLMFLFLFLGILKIFYERNRNKSVKTEGLKESTFIKDDIPLNKTGNGIGILDAIDVYTEVKSVDQNDSLQVKRMNDKLNKIIKNEK